MMLDAAPACAYALFRHQVTHGRFALAASGGHTEFELKLVESFHAFREGRANLAVGY